ncbi:hypothetical protein ACFWWC_40055 [Streptomyces sp. NPDC058642]|uniref:hypothetical protein n=1 Tax=Streptomyces sp. NPDC058642 TaxID=3346572 RepID=UPI00366A285B
MDGAVDAGEEAVAGVSADGVPAGALLGWPAPDGVADPESRPVPPGSAELGCGVGEAGAGGWVS